MGRLQEMWDFLIRFPELHRAVLNEMDERDRLVAEADAARRHAQAVGSELVQEKRDLQRQLEAAQGARDEFERERDALHALLMETRAQLAQITEERDRAESLAVSNEKRELEAQLIKEYERGLADGRKSMGVSNG